MLVTPKKGGEADVGKVSLDVRKTRHHSTASFDHLIMKAARSVCMQFCYRRFVPTLRRQLQLVAQLNVGCLF